MPECSADLSQQLSILPEEAIYASALEADAGRDEVFMAMGRRIVFKKGIPAKILQIQFSILCEYAQAAWHTRQTRVRKYEGKQGSSLCK
jgi:hypothetical protein